MDRLSTVEARRAGMLALLPSNYRIEREGDALLLLRDDGSAVAAFRIETVPPAEAAKTAEEERGRSRAATRYWGRTGANPATGGGPAK